MAFPRPARPRALMADLRAVFGAEHRHKLLFAAIAIGMTSLIVTGFIVESRHGILPEGPQIVYAANWSVNRTDAQIEAQQKIDQKKREAQQAARRAQFQKLARQLGLN